MKILCVGCSFTNGYTGSLFPLGSYPYIIKENIKDSIVYNMGVGGGSNILSNIILEHAIAIIKPDFVVRQITFKERFAIRNNTDTIDFPSLIKRISDNYYVLDDIVLKKVFAYWSSSKIYHTGDQYTKKELEKIQKFFYKTFSESILDEIHDSVISKTERLLKDIPNVIFSWRTEDNLCRFPSVEESVGLNREYFSDFNGHFNRNGNLQIFEKIIKPEILKYV